MSVLVIGAGVVGLAVAAELAGRGRQVIVCERGARPGEATSARHSGVIHAGIYHPPCALKTVLAIEGRERLIALCRGAGVPLRPIGKLIVATTADQLPALAALEANARACGAPALAALDRRQIRRAHPGVRAIAGLWSAATAVGDGAGLVAALHRVAVGRGAVVLCRRDVVGVDPTAAGFDVAVATGAALERHRFAAVVNSAGLHADAVARLVHPVEPLALVKGSYFAARAAPPSEALVYPIPPVGGAGLGVHLTHGATGGIFLGPDAEAAASRDDLSVDPRRAAAFWRSARQWWPALRLRDLRPAWAGIRPKRAVGQFADFHIAAAPGLPGWIDLIGIESPGMTACLAIAQRVADLAGAA